MMKFTAIAFNILLAIPFLVSAIKAVQFYNDYKLYNDAGLADSHDKPFAWPYICVALVYLVSFKIALWLNVKKKFTTNIKFSSIMISIYIALLIFKVV